MLYALFVSIIISGEITETEWKTYTRFEECWEVASVIVKHREDITARCVMVEE